MAVRLSSLRSGLPLPTRKFLVLISVRGWVDPRAIVRLDGLGQLKIPMTWGNEPAPFRLVAYYLNQLHYRYIPKINRVTVAILTLQNFACAFMWLGIACPGTFRSIQRADYANLWLRVSNVTSRKSNKYEITASLGLEWYSLWWSFMCVRVTRRWFTCIQIVATQLQVPMHLARWNTKYSVSTAA
jgi:hypothetical protein